MDGFRLSTAGLRSPRESAQNTLTCVRYTSASPATLPTSGWNAFGDYVRLLFSQTMPPLVRYRASSRSLRVHSDTLGRTCFCFIHPYLLRLADVNVGKVMHEPEDVQ